MESLDQELKENLVARARQAREWAYAPYSRYRVGAALLAASGKVYDGVNIENASYGATVCAERTAIFKAVSEGEREFSALAVVSSGGGSPCGVCRQVLAEFGLGTLVLLADAEGRVVRETTAGGLLPDAFGPGDLSAA